MKTKFYFVAALAATLLASCADEQFVGENSPNVVQNESTENAIVFGSGFKAVTRAPHTGADAATMLNNTFVLAGTKGTTPTTYIFDQYQTNYVANTAYTTESNTADWEYVGLTPWTTSTLPSGAIQTIKYWDYSTTQYDFAAFSRGLGYDEDNNPATDNTYATTSAIAASDKHYTLSGSAEHLKACYISNLVTAYNRDNVNDYGNTVQFTFRSLATKIRLALYETVPGYSVKDVLFYSAASGGSPSTTATLFTADDSQVLPTGNGTMTITFPTVGWNNSPHDGNATDYNKAHVSFAATNPSTDLSKTLELDPLATFSAADKKEDNTSPVYLGRASNEATYAGGKVGSPAAGKYFTILPYEAGKNLKLRIKYTLVSTDGSGEEIDVDNATAIIPQQYAKWNPNYAYTYIFKISDMTNGSTGVDGDDNIVTGLTPITFDAVVIDSEDGIQETITTVSSPSITTYAKGVVVTGTNEYNVNNNIYVVANNGTDNVTLTPGTNAWLYTVTLQDGAAQTINEASVDNALANGKYDALSKKYTVTDANGKKLEVTVNDGLSAITAIPATDSPNGNELPIIGAKFTPDATGTYVFRYQTVAPTYDGGTVLATSTSLDGYFTESAGVYTQCGSNTVADGTTTYYKRNNLGTYQYKIIKVVTAP